MSKFLLLMLLALNSWAQDHLALAKKYAPIVTQGQGALPRADIFTRVDYDGDWDPNNNWDNLEKFPQPLTVYWDIIESDHHYFITYALFYPRDYAATCFWIHCHENDFEGMRVTIKKPDTLVRLETLAHNRMKKIDNPPGIHVVIEKEGHGIHPVGSRPFDEKHVTYVPAQYELRSLNEIWQKRDTSLFSTQFDYRGQKIPASFGGEKWLLFGWGAAKPAWSWEVWGSDWKKGEWFLDPAKGTAEKYLHHPYLKN